MLRYAQIDTHYLVQIRDRLAGELHDRGLYPIAREDFERACLAYRHVREDTTPPCWKIKGARKLTPQQAAVLAALCDYREGVAKKIDRPVFKVIGANTLLRLAEKSPTSVEGMLRMDLPGKKNVQRHADGLIKAIRAGLEAEPLRFPRKKRMDDAYLARESALRNWRKLTARRMNVNSAVVLPRDLLYDIIAQNPITIQDLEQVLADVPWRLDRFGEEVLAVIKQANQTGRKH
jgi:ribonuclease D